MRVQAWRVKGQIRQQSGSVLVARQQDTRGTGPGYSSSTQRGQALRIYLPAKSPLHLLLSGSKADRQCPKTRRRPAVSPAVAFWGFVLAELGLFQEGVWGRPLTSPQSSPRGLLAALCPLPQALSSWFLGLSVAQKHRTQATRLS